MVINLTTYGTGGNQSQLIEKVQVVNNRTTYGTGGNQSQLIEQVIINLATYGKQVVINLTTY